MRQLLSASLLVSLAVSCGGPHSSPALPSLDPNRILARIKVLASDEFEGREPASAAEPRVVEYIAGEMQRIGLAPGNPNGSYTQDVPLVGITTTATGTLNARGKTLPLDSYDAWVPVLRSASADIDKAGVIFVGYGVQAPEYDWDDYKGIDTRGKVLVMLVNDPPVMQGDALDDQMFKGKAMTYYGRWTYKFEIGAQKAAAAVLLVHETGPAGYPYEVVKGSWSRENFDIGGGAGDPTLDAWISQGTAESLLAASGQDFAALKKAAARKDFRPVALDATLSARARSTLRPTVSKNVAGRLPGSDPTLRDEVVLFTAHWDHLGRDPKLQGDNVFNGAADNASGVAMMLEVAEGMARVKPAPKRSLVFLAVTAEEKGLLGAKYYAQHPLYPLAKTLADFNLDVVNLWGKTSDIISVGMGHTTLDDLLAVVARDHGRTAGPDVAPEKGSYYRSDHFEFAKVGVPAMDFKGGSHFIGKPAEFGEQKRIAYTQDDYHKPSDEVKPGWDLRGAAADAELLIDLALRVANGTTWPSWKPTSEFKDKR